MAETLHTGGDLQVLEELLKCGTNIYLWKYGTDGHLSGTNSEHLVLDQFFTNSGCKDYMLNQKDCHAPLIMGGERGLMWSAVYEWNGDHQKEIYVIGPVLNSEITASDIEQSLHDFKVEFVWRQGYTDLMRDLPVVPTILFYQYALMLHYCVTGKKLNRSDIRFQELNTSIKSKKSEEPYSRRMNLWLAEQTLLSMIREGDLNYKKALTDINSLSAGVRSGGTPMLRAIISCTSFTSLCVREAIQAGISPDIAYAVGDNYIQNMAKCKTITDIRALNHAMYEDFVMRVHKHRTNPKVTMQIQKCRDYIETHADSPLTLKILSRQIGYSEYHLSRKFKEEMGISISEYIRDVRVEQAKILLESTNDSIAKIALDLQFSSSSHFSGIFRQITGQSPVQYRRERQKVIIRQDETEE